MIQLFNKISRIMVKLLSIQMAILHLQGFVTHVPGTAPITITQMGTYLITYEVFVSGGPYAFALFNGDNQISGSNYGDTTGNATKNGQVITTLNELDVLSLRTIFAGPKNLGNAVLGISVISASIVILKLS
ncbi:hypothetical protein [Lysinibacillus xylanilyticus]|uniref:hypothetical protein n=1 Tax=Lysinibacillus xylanilyticus TaxID=582475 RepID=UPI003D07D4A6